MATITPINMILIDWKFSPRQYTDQERVDEYADAMKAGARFPPILVAKVEGKLMVIDGFHRLEAVKKLGLNSISTEFLGTKTHREAFLEAVRHNISHGKSLSRQERLAAYKQLVALGYTVERIAGSLTVSREEVSRASENKVYSAFTGGEIHYPTQPTQEVTNPPQIAVPEIPRPETNRILLTKENSHLLRFPIHTSIAFICPNCGTHDNMDFKVRELQIDAIVPDLVAALRQDLATFLADDAVKPKSGETIK